MDNLRWKIENGFIDVSEETFNLIFDYLDDGFIKKNNIRDIVFKDDYVMVQTNLGKKYLIDKIHLERFKLQKIMNNISK